MSTNFENRQRRIGLYVFLAWYLLFIATVIIAGFIQSAQNGGGWVF